MSDHHLHHVQRQRRDRMKLLRDIAHKRAPTNRETLRAVFKVNYGLARDTANEVIDDLIAIGDLKEQDGELIQPDDTHD